MVAHLSNLVDITSHHIIPLALFAKLFLKIEGLEGTAARMFGAYDEFLSILNDENKRRHLDRLGQPDVATDEIYQRVRALGHDFQDALDSVFFNPEDCPELYGLTKTYGVF